MNLVKKGLLIGISAALLSGFIFTGAGPVNRQAVATAEQATNAPQDRWGRTIRTTNLPSNYKEYPYILESLPNAMYEMPHKKFMRNSTSRTAAEQLADERSTDKVVDKWVTMVNQYGQQIFNVDYKTVGQKWATTYLGTVVNFGSKTTDRTIKYVNWVKKNHIQIEGSLIAEPSMIFEQDYCILIRSQFKFRIKNYDKNEDIFSDFWFPEKTYQKNVWYEGYIDVPLTTNVYEGSYNDWKVYNFSTVERASKVWKKK